MAVTTPYNQGRRGVNGADRAPQGLNPQGLNPRGIYYNTFNTNTPSPSQINTGYSDITFDDMSAFGNPIPNISPDLNVGNGVNYQSIPLRSSGLPEIFGNTEGPGTDGFGYGKSKAPPPPGNGISWFDTHDPITGEQTGQGALEPSANALAALVGAGASYQAVRENARNNRWNRKQGNRVYAAGKQDYNNQLEQQHNRLLASGDRRETREQYQEKRGLA